MERILRFVVRALFALQATLIIAAGVSYFLLGVPTRDADHTYAIARHGGGTNYFAAPVGKFIDISPIVAVVCFFVCIALCFIPFKASKE